MLLFSFTGKSSSSSCHISLFFLHVSVLYLLLIFDPEHLLHVFIHHVGDADSRDDFEEVRSDSPVESGDSLMTHDVSELSQHGELG